MRLLSIGCGVSIYAIFLGELEWKIITMKNSVFHGVSLAKIVYIEMYIVNDF